MGKLENAFLEGKISPVLLQNWEGQNIPIRYYRCKATVDIKKSLLLTLNVGIISFLLIVILREHSFVGRLLIQGILVASFVVCLVATPTCLMQLRARSSYLDKHLFRRVGEKYPRRKKLLPDTQFLQDVDELMIFLPIASHKSIDELKNRARMTMSAQVEQIVRAEKDPTSSESETEELRRIAKQMFGIMSRFGLISKPIDQFFKDVRTVKTEDVVNPANTPHAGLLTS